MMFQSPMCYLYRYAAFMYLLMRCLRNLFALICLSFGLQEAAHPATDLAAAPINFLVSAQVKPNIYFILDDSGSMVWSYVGDEVVSRGYEKAVGYRSALCNKIYYNPTVKYPVPVRADGSFFPQQSFTAAKYDGFSDDSVAVDLSSSFMAWRTSDTSPALPKLPTTVSYREDCTGPFGKCTSSGGNDFANVAERAYYYVYRGNKPESLGDGFLSDPCLDRPPSSDWAVRMSVRISLIGSATIARAF
jgi:hypothetical protein